MPERHPSSNEKKALEDARTVDLSEMATAAQTHTQWFATIYSLVVCDESGHTKFPFSFAILSWGEL